MRLDADLRLALGALMLLTLSSCVVVTTGETGHRETRIYLGYVHVSEPTLQEAKKGVKIEDIETVGLRLERGVGVGYFHERVESIPLDSRVVIHVQNEEQYWHLLGILNKLELGEEKQPCVIIEK